jgi:cation:H+ antiporter
VLAAAALVIPRARHEHALVGTVFAALASSLPELVTAIAAVRIGAVNRAIGDVFGGNSFEVLFLAAADSSTARARSTASSTTTICSLPCSPS